MGSQLERGILAVVAAIAITLVVFRASAAEVPVVSEADETYEVDEIEDEEEVISFHVPGVGDRLVAAAERQVEILQRLPIDIANGLFVDLPHKSRAFEAAASVKDPRTIAIALAADADALGAHVSGIARGAEAQASTMARGAQSVIGQVLWAPIVDAMRVPR